MDLPRLDALLAYWRNKPPVHVSVAAYVGWGEPSKTAAPSGNLDALLASTPRLESPS